MKTKFPLIKSVGTALVLAGTLVGPVAATNPGELRSVGFAVAAGDYNNGDSFLTLPNGKKLRRLPIGWDAGAYADPLPNGSADLNRISHENGAFRRAHYMSLAE